MVGGNDTLLADLNANPIYHAPNLLDSFPNQINNNPNSTIPDFHPEILSHFYDIPTFTQKISSSKHPVLASLNCQSLQSKHSDIQNFLTESSSTSNHISILALQETWRINHPSSLNIKNYTLIHKDRSPGQGGGVGFYVRTGLNYNIVDDLSTFIPKTFEALTIETVIHGRKMCFSSVYRSPTAPPGTSPAQHLTNFIIHMDTLLSSLSSLGHP
jgi:hypothetical protein